MLIGFFFLFPLNECRGAVFLKRRGRCGADGAGHFVQFVLNFYSSFPELFQIGNAPNFSATPIHSGSINRVNLYIFSLECPLEATGHTIQ